MARKRAGEGRAKGREHMVVKRAAFARCIDEAIRTRFGGNRNAAARSAGIPHSTLKRYHESRGASVRDETLNKLFRLVGPERTSQLGDGLISPLVREALSRYDRWVRTETAYLAGGVTLGRMAAGWKPKDHLELEASTGADWDGAQELQRALKYLQARFPDAWAPLRSALKGRERQPRARLAFARVIAPLLRRDDTLFVERDWRELSASEIKRFIKAGVTRETILLDRPDALRRAQEWPQRFDARTRYPTKY